MSTIAETNRPTITATNLRRGDRPMETTNFAFFAHPRSGEVYACRYKVDTQRIIDAAGPVHHSEHDRFERVGDQPSEAESERCREILSNAFVTAETGKWLDREIWDDR